jgi:probable rRNA maturation factor
MALIDFAISNRQDLVSLDTNLVRRAAEIIFQDITAAEIQISISLVDDAEMSELHGRYLADRTTTDVLTFVDQETDILSIEIVANGPYALREGTERGWSGEQELLLYVIHGMLHGIGMDDKTSADREAMFEAQRNTLNQLGLDPLVVRRVVQWSSAEEVADRPASERPCKA